MSGSSSSSRVSIPNNLRKTIQSLKEIAKNHSDDEIYAMLRECSMDPNETAQKLLLQDPFHEVKRKRDKRKESNKEHADTRWRPALQGRGGRGGGRGNYSPRYVSHDAGGERNTGKENGIHQATDKGITSSSSPPSQDMQSKSTTHVSSSVAGLLNGPAKIENQVTVQGSTPKDSSVSGTISVKETSAATSTDKTEKPSTGDAKSSVSVQHVSTSENNFLQPPKAASGSGLYASGSDPVLVPSLDARIPGSVGTIKREVGGERITVEVTVNKGSSETNHSYVNEKMQGKSQGFDGNQLSETSQPTHSLSRTSSAGSRPSSNYNNRSQQLNGPQKAVGPTKEWKPKSTNVKPTPVAGKHETIYVEPATQEAVALPIPSSSSLSLDETTSKLQNKLGELQVSDTKHVIIPNHLQVPESERSGLSFGSFDANFGLTINFMKDTESEKSSAELSETSQEIGENVEVLASSVQIASPSGQEAEIADRSLSPAKMPENFTSSADHPQSQSDIPENLTSRDPELSSTIATAPEYDQSKTEAAPVTDSSQHSVVHTSPAYSNFGLVPQMLGNQIAAVEGAEPQARDVTRIPSFLVQQPFDPATSYYTSMYRPTTAEGDGRFSPFFVPATATKYNGNIAVLPAQTGQTPQESGNSLVLSSTGPAPLVTSGMMQTSLAASQHSVPIFRQPPGVHIPYPPNFLPYSQYFSPFYIPSPTMHPFLSNGAFPQQPPTGNIYPTPGAAGAAPVKYSLSQYKPAANTGNPSHIGMPTGYGTYSPGAVNSGSSTGSEDLASSQYKENNVYIAGQQSEGSVWIPTPGRDISAMQATSFYNLPTQGQHMTFPGIGNPIAIFFIQLIGVSVSELEPEFQPVVNYLLPHIISHKQEAHDMHLQLLQDMTSRLLVFLPQLETDLANFTDAAESNIRFFAMLAGPFYPILHILKEREAARALLNTTDSDAFKSSQTSTLTVSSNFEAQPRRSRSPSHFVQPTSCSLVFRSDAVLMLLRKAYKDSHLGIVCRIASRALYTLVEPSASQEESVPSSDLASFSNTNETAKSELPSYVHLADYSSLFGEEFKVPDACWDATYLNILDTAAIEEGVIHVLYACASQPLLCLKLADSNSDFWSILPLVQALLPALRPPVNSPDQVDDSFSQWKHSSVQHALSQIVIMSSSSVFRPLLHACAGYLSSFSPSHAKAACVLLDMCSGLLSPWISTVIAKVDLAIELTEDLLGVIQGASQFIARGRAALKYILLALSGHMDDVLAKYKENKHKLLFLLEMLEPFLDPAITAMRSTIAFGDVSAVFLEKQERTCAIALNVIRTAARRPAVLPSLESEWRCGSVAPSVLLSVLGPHIPLPSDIDLCKCSTSKVTEQEPHSASSGTSIHSHGVSSKSAVPSESDEKIDVSEPAVKTDAFEDTNLLFAPPELKKTMLISPANHFMWNNPAKKHGTAEGKNLTENFIYHCQLDNSFFVEFFNVQADYMQLVDHHDCELKSSEFQRLALDLCSHHDVTPEGHDAAIDALLLAAECYVNPFFMVSFKPASNLINQLNTIRSKINKGSDFMELGRNSQNNKNGLEKIAHLEAKRDKAVLQILLQAAKLNMEYEMRKSQGGLYTNDSDREEQDMGIRLLDLQSADAVTLVRQNQALLCHFIMQQLLREQHSSHEILLQSLLFLLHSATELFCSPEDVIDIILQSAENLNGMLMSLYYQLKEGNMHFDLEKLHIVQRRWVLLQRLVLVSSGSDDRTNFLSSRTNQLQYKCLVPPSAWLQKISKFSSNPYPLPRFLGWMAVSRYARLYLNERLFLASDLSQLTSLLTIFTDELALVDSVSEQKQKASDPEQSVTKEYPEFNKEIGHPYQSGGQDSFRVLYPDLHNFFPNMKEQFGSFGEIILEAVGLQLKCLPHSAVPDVLCWFSDLCMWPYSGNGYSNHTVQRRADNLKGYNAVNAKVILLYLLESIVSEHMEAMVPEMPRVAQILISLCRSSYCDVAFLESALCLLQPLISYFLRKVTGEGKLFSNVISSLDFELNFGEIFDSIRCRKECQDVPEEKKLQGSLMIFILGALFPDLSFTRKMEMLQSLLEWVDFTTSEPTSSFYDYLSAFRKVVDTCHVLLEQNLSPFGILKPFKETEASEHHSIGSLDSSSYFPTGFTNSGETEEIDGTVVNNLPDKGFYHLSADEIKEFSGGLQLLISKLIPAIEVSWKLHHQLAVKLTYKLSKCFLFSRCLFSISQEGLVIRVGDDGSISLSESSDLLSKHWQIALEGLTGVIIAIQQNQCWQVGSAMLDYLLSLPKSISLDCVLCSICSAIKNFVLHAPRISWRLQTDKWLTHLFMRGIGNLEGNEESLVDLFSSMLGHWEPEQRSVALQHLGRTVCLDYNYGVAKLSHSYVENLIASDSAISVPESIVSVLVTSTWDKVAAVALSDPSMLLKSHATALLSGYIPYVDRAILQSFLVATNTIMGSMGRISPSMEECHVTRLSLGLLASACLYSPAEDIVLIPENVWRNLENIGMSKTGGLDDGDKKLCLALCKLKDEPDGAKEALKNALSSSSTTKQSDPNFRSTRESILQVLSSLTSIQSYFDFFSRRADHEYQELEEAEIEMDLLQKEKAQQEVSKSYQEETPVPSTISYDKVDGGRLQKIKDEIQLLEKSKLREEIAARRQKKLLMRRARQRCLEEAASREMQLLQEIDRERTIENERTVERQRQLELERAKTREVQFNLEMERERQTQRELQRELEQVESGVRSSRREFSSNINSRPRERYRERDNVRPGNEGSLRPSSRGRESGLSQTATASPGAAPPAQTVVLAGSRSFSGQLPTILQSRERMEERSAAYEDSFEGSRDSGDANSIGDPELASAFDGLPGGFGSVPRHGSRASKSRQIAERRERDGRREGKWERKH